MYRGVAYAIRARPGRDEWTWTIYPPHGLAKTGEFTGSRAELVALIENKIDDWFKNQRTAQRRRSLRQA